MAKLVFIVLFCLLIITTLAPHATSQQSCGQSNGPYSPPYNPNGTPARLTLNGFGQGEDGGAPSKCDESYHPLPERVAALSTGWYDNNSRCGQNIKIMAENGMVAIAKVVDECDSMNGCDQEHAYQPPCGTDVVDVSQAVWDDLGLNSDVGDARITWTMA